MTTLTLEPQITVTTLLTMQRENKIFTGGLCLSKESCSTLIETCNDFLHPREKTYFSGFTHLKRQYSYLLGRYCAKKAIAIYAGVNDSTKMYIENGVFQQPIVHGSLHQNLQVSISHSDTIGSAIAFTEAHPMGIDVEIICDSKTEALQTQMTSMEKAQMAANFNDATQLILRWTAKEALSKVLKCGLMVSSHVLEVKTSCQEENYTTSYFTNFHQYKAISFIVGNVIISLVCPIKTQLLLNFQEIQKISNCNPAAKK